MNAEKEKRAIQYLKSFEPESESYYLCYSGGKDSDAVRILADLANVNYECHHELTTVDAPETVYYVKEVMRTYGDEQYIRTENEKYYQYGTKGFIHIPPKSMWQLIIEKKMPPTRIMRYCCAELKEKGGKGRLKITGVRWAESVKRAESADFIRSIGAKKALAKAAEDSGAAYKVTRGGGYSAER